MTILRKYTLLIERPYTVNYSNIFTGYAKNLPVYYHWSKNCSQRHNRPLFVRTKCCIEKKSTWWNNYILFSQKRIGFCLEIKRESIKWTLGSYSILLCLQFYKGIRMCHHHSGWKVGWGRKTNATFRLTWLHSKTFSQSKTAKQKGLGYEYAALYFLTLIAMPISMTTS